MYPSGGTLIQPTEVLGIHNDRHRGNLMIYP